MFLRLLLLVYQVGDVYYVITSIMKREYNGFIMFYPLLLELIVINIFYVKKSRLLDINSRIGVRKIRIIELNVLFMLLFSNTIYYYPYYNIILIMLLL